MQHLTILGSTGSIGTQTLEVVRSNPDRFRVRFLTTNGNVELLAAQAAEFRPDAVVVSGADALEKARGMIDPSIEILEGVQGLSTVAADGSTDTVVVALVGFAGLRPTVAAVTAGKRVALANKESMVVAGELINRLVRTSGAALIPIDSEHSAIHQCLAGETPDAVERLILTASGGPFRNVARSEFDTISPARALQHPNWSMGPKITIDSATLMNKGLEVIEARWLFDVPAGRIDVLVHPESIVHSMVEFVDGSVKAQMGLPDMRLPIQYALAWPERLASDYPRLRLSSIGALTFSEPDTTRFPCLRLAYEALEAHGTAPAVLNAANEIAVAAFLAETVSFAEIPVLVERALHEIPIESDPSLETIVEADKRTRESVRSYLGSRSLHPRNAG